MIFFFRATLALAILFLAAFSWIGIGVRAVDTTSTTPVLDSVLEFDMNEIFPDDESVKGYDQLLQLVREDGKTIYYRADSKHPIFIRAFKDSGKQIVVLGPDEAYLSPDDTRTKIVLRQQESNPSVYTVHMAVISDSNDIVWDSVIVEQRKEDEDLIAEFRKSQGIKDSDGDNATHCAWIGNMILCSGTTEESPVDRMDMLPVFNDMPFESTDVNDGTEWFQDVDDNRPRKVVKEVAAKAPGNEESKQPVLDKSALVETHPNSLRKREINYESSAQELVPNKTEDLIAPGIQGRQEIHSNSDSVKVNTENSTIPTTVATTTLVPVPKTTTKAGSAAKQGSTNTTRSRATLLNQQGRRKSPIIALTSQERELYENPPGRMPLAYNMERLSQGPPDYYEMDFDKYAPVREYDTINYDHIFPDYSYEPQPPPKPQKFRNKVEPNPKWPYPYNFNPLSPIYDPMPVSSSFHSKYDSRIVDTNQWLKNGNSKYLPAPEFVHKGDRKPTALPRPAMTTKPPSVLPFSVPSYGTKTKIQNAVKKSYLPPQYPIRYPDYPPFPMLYDY